MDVGSITYSSVVGISRGINQANEASAKLASAEQSSNDQSNKETTQALVELEQGKIQVQASARVAQTAGDVIGSIIDIHA